MIGPWRGLRDRYGWTSHHIPGINLYFSSARLVDVRGHDAVLTPFVFTPPSAIDQPFPFTAERFVQWLETNDTRVTVGGVGLSDSEILNIAWDLQTVDADTWFALRGAAPDPTPTPVLPDASLPGPDGPPPADEATAREQVIKAVEVASAGASTR